MLCKFQIAERADGAPLSVALLRWALVIVFVWFGCVKFTSYEANGIAAFIEHSPIIGWLHSLFGVQGASDIIGILELATAVALALGARLPFFRRSAQPCRVQPTLSPCLSCLVHQESRLHR
jgi:uncharacterized membrane protein YkgB